MEKATALKANGQIAKTWCEASNVNACGHTTDSSEAPEQGNRLGCQSHSSLV